jgi:hypothetical protein
MANKVVMNVHGAMLYREKIKDDEVSVQVTKSLIDGYLLYKKVTLDFLEVESCVEEDNLKFCLCTCSCTYLSSEGGVVDRVETKYTMYQWCVELK